MAAARVVLSDNMSWLHNWWWRPTFHWFKHKQVTMPEYWLPVVVVKQSLDKIFRNANSFFFSLVQGVQEFNSIHGRVQDPDLKLQFKFNPSNPNMLDHTQEILF